MGPPVLLLGLLPLSLAVHIFNPSLFHLQAPLQPAPAMGNKKWGVRSAPLDSGPSAFHDCTADWQTWETGSSGTIKIKRERSAGSPWDLQLQFSHPVHLQVYNGVADLPSGKVFRVSPPSWAPRMAPGLEDSVSLRATFPPSGPRPVLEGVVANGRYHTCGAAGVRTTRKPPMLVYHGEGLPHSHHGDHTHAPDDHSHDETHDHGHGQHSHGEDHTHGPGDEPHDHSHDQAHTHHGDHTHSPDDHSHDHEHDHGHDEDHTHGPGEAPHDHSHDHASTYHKTGEQHTHHSDHTHAESDHSHDAEHDHGHGDNHTHAPDIVPDDHSHDHDQDHAADTGMTVQRSGRPAWPNKVLGLYILLADDDEDGFDSAADWEPELFPWQQEAANVLFFTFIHPDTMAIPPSYVKLAASRGSGLPGAVPKDTVIMFAIGGYSYSLKPNPWHWLTSREAAEEMAVEVAAWPEKFGCDGIDLDLEEGAGAKKEAGPNMIHFIRKLKQLAPDILISQPTYGYPQVQAEIDVINASWDSSGTSLGLADTLGIMVYEGTQALNYVKNFAAGSSQWGGFPITASAPTSAILLGCKGAASSDTITSLARATLDQDLGGIMVWYVSIKNGFHYTTFWDASTHADSVAGYLAARKMLEAEPAVPRLAQARAAFDWSEYIRAQ